MDRARRIPRRRFVVALYAWLGVRHVAMSSDCVGDERPLSADSLAAR